MPPLATKSGSRTEDRTPPPSDEGELMDGNERIRFEEPGFARFLFASTAAAWIWLPVRLYLGYEWAHAGWEKVFGDPSWLSSTEPLKGFVGFALSQAGQGVHSAVNYGWYAAFLRWIGGDGANVMSKVISLGELRGRIGTDRRVVHGIAAFFGGMLSMSFGLAGVAGVNPVFFLIEVLLILAWRNAGWIGLDRWVLPALGTPWQPGTLSLPVATTEGRRSAAVPEKERTPAAKGGAERREAVDAFRRSRDEMRLKWIRWGR